MSSKKHQQYRIYGIIFFCDKINFTLYAFDIMNVDTNIYIFIKIYKV
jgi:hypothetical protein